MGCVSSKVVSPTCERSKEVQTTVETTLEAATRNSNVDPGSGRGDTGNPLPQQTKEDSDGQVLDSDDDEDMVMHDGGKGRRQSAVSVVFSSAVTGAKKWARQIQDTWTKQGGDEENAWRKSTFTLREGMSSSVNHSRVDMSALDEDVGDLIDPKDFHFHPAPTLAAKVAEVEDLGNTDIQINWDAVLGLSPVYKARSLLSTKGPNEDSFVRTFKIYHEDNSLTHVLLKRKQGARVGVKVKRRSPFPVCEDDIDDADALEAIANTITTFCNEQKANCRTLGDGKSWTLAQRVLAFSGAQGPRGFNFGLEIDGTNARSGDIITFTDVTFKVKTGVGAKHVAIFQSQKDDILTVFQQKQGEPVHTHKLLLKNLRGGTIQYWRPYPLQHEKDINWPKT